MAGWWACWLLPTPRGRKAAEAIAQLKELGLRVLMVSGDREAPALAMARRVGVDDVRAEVRPGDKAAIVRDLQAKGHRVAVVGDGINDAPAARPGRPGHRDGHGAPTSPWKPATFTLVRGDLRDAVTAIRLSRATMRTIRQNLFWAFAYNVALIPVAAGVLFPSLGIQLNPMLAAGAMAFSDVSVIGNSLRLRGFVRTVPTRRRSSVAHPTAV